VLESYSLKLSYLCAWQPLHKHSHRLMSFNPGGQPICINLGTTCSISNIKADFTDLQPTSNTVLHGITSGLDMTLVANPFCIDSGTTCSISNNKVNFTDLQQTSNTVLHSITSGQDIPSKGTLCWTITNNNVDKNDLHI
jgi:hypothetical protein